MRLRIIADIHSFLHTRPDYVLQVALIDEGRCIMILWNLKTSDINMNMYEYSLNTCFNAQLLSVRSRCCSPAAAQHRRHSY